MSSNPFGSTQLTQDHSGEIEGTYLRTAVRHANLLALLSDSEDDQVVTSEMLSRMESHRRERLRGFRLAEGLDQSRQNVNDRVRPVNADEVWGQHAEQLPAEEFNMLCAILQDDPQERDTPVRNSVTYLDAISQQANVYAIWESLKYKDSSVLYQDKVGRGAGVIQKIFLHNHQSSLGVRSMGQFFVVRRYEAIAPELDGFRQYGPAAGFCSRPLTNLLKVVPLRSVICHVAVTEFPEDEMVHILPVNRVSDSPS